LAPSISGVEEEIDNPQPYDQALPCISVLIAVGYSQLPDKIRPL
jgi:hypothetical protein